MYRIIFYLLIIFTFAGCWSDKEPTLYFDKEFIFQHNQPFLEVTVIKIYRDDYSHYQYNSIDYLIKNKSDSTIVAFKGRMFIYDIFNELVSNCEVTKEHYLLPLTDTIYTASYKHNDLRESNSALRYGNHDNFTYKFRLDHIIFENSEIKF